MVEQLFRIIIVGDSSVGKTCIMLKFTEGVFKENHDATIGVELGLRVLKLETEDVKLQIWDTSGQENFRSVTRSFYRRSACAILVFDFMNEESFANCEHWLQEIKNNSKKEIVVFLVGNKRDLVEAENLENYQKKANEFVGTNGLSGYFEVSAKSGENIEFIFKAIAEKLIATENKQGPYDSGKFEIQLVNNQSGKAKKCC